MRRRHPIRDHIRDRVCWNIMRHCSLDTCQYIYERWRYFSVWWGPDPPVEPESLFSRMIREGLYKSELDLFLHGPNSEQKG